MPAREPSAEPSAVHFPGRRVDNEQKSMIVKEQLEGKERIDFSSRATGNE